MSLTTIWERSYTEKNGWRRLFFISTKRLELNANYFFVHNNIGIDYLYHEKFEDAETWFAKALAVNPRFAEGHQKMAATKFKLGKVKEALEHYGLAVEIDPQNKTVHNDFGCVTHGDRTAWQGGSLLSAMHCGSILIMPMQTTTLELHIYISGQTENAARHFEKALATRPEYAQEQQKLKETLVSKAE